MTNFRIIINSHTHGIVPHGDGYKVVRDIPENAEFLNSRGLDRPFYYSSYDTVDSDLQRKLCAWYIEKLRTQDNGTVHIVPMEPEAYKGDVAINGTHYFVILVAEDKKAAKNITRLYAAAHTLPLLGDCISALETYRKPAGERRLQTLNVAVNVAHTISSIMYTDVDEWREEMKDMLASEEALKVAYISAMACGDMLRDMRTVRVPKCHDLVLDLLKRRHEFDEKQLLRMPHECPETGELMAWQNFDKFLQGGKPQRAKLGGYLQRLFPSMAASLITKEVEKYQGAKLVGGMHYTESTEEMCRIMREATEQVWRNGDVSTFRTFPHTCMTKNVSAAVLYSRSSTEQEDWMHPYVVYDHALGWSMAYIKNIKGNIAGRAIVHKDDKTFVRAFALGDNNVHAAMEHALAREGYERIDSWEDYTVAYVPLHGNEDLSPCDAEFWTPYIDGNAQRGEVISTRDPQRPWVITIRECGDVDFAVTCGFGGFSPQCTCERCGDEIDAEDAYTVYDDDDDHNGSDWCYDCARDYSQEIDGVSYNVDNLTWCEQNEQYDHTRYVEFSRYHQSYLTGDSAVWSECDGDRYDRDDDDIILLSNGDWCMYDNAWEDVDGEWHHNSVEKVYHEELDGYVLHDDPRAQNGVTYPTDETEVEDA